MRTLLLAVGTFVFPGLGQAAVANSRRANVWAVGWALVVPLAMLLTLWSVWLFFVAFGLRIASAIHAGALVRRDTRVDVLAALPLVAVTIAVVTFTLLRFTVIEGFKAPSSSMYPTVLIGDHVFVDKLTMRWRPIERGEIAIFRYPCDPTRDYLKRVIALGGDTVEVRCNVVYVNGKAIANALVDAAAIYEDHDELDDRWFTRTASRYHEVLDGHGYDVFHDPDRPTRDKNGGLDGDSRDFPQRGRGAVVASCKNTDGPSSGATHQVLGKVVDTKPEATACEPQSHYVVPDHHAFVLGDNRYNSNDSRVWGSVALDQIKGRVFAIWLGGGPHGIDWSRIGSVR